MQVSTPAPARKSHRNLSVLLVEDSRLLAERLRETILNVPGVHRVGSVDRSQYIAAVVLDHKSGGCLAWNLDCAAKHAGIAAPSGRLRWFARNRLN
jgi:hypothetical protein